MDEGPTGRGARQRERKKRWEKRTDERSSQARDTREIIAIGSALFFWHFLLFSSRLVACQFAVRITHFSFFLFFSAFRTFTDPRETGGAACACTRRVMHVIYDLNLLRKRRNITKIWRCSAAIWYSLLREIQNSGRFFFFPFFFLFYIKRTALFY